MRFVELNDGYDIGEVTVAHVVATFAFALNNVMACLVGFTTTLGKTKISNDSVS